MSGDDREPEYQDTVVAMFGLMLAASKIADAESDIIVTDTNICIDIIALLITNYSWDNDRETQLEMLAEIVKRVAIYRSTEPLREIPLHKNALT